MALSDVKIRNAKTKKKSYKLYDGEGLFLHMLHSGGKVWRYKYQFNDKERLLTIGKYKQGNSGIGFSLQDARKERAKAYSLIISGFDPAQEKKKRKALQKEQELIENPPEPTGKTFKEVVYIWADYRALPKTKRSWKQSHKRAVLKSLEREVIPVIGDRIIHTLTSDDIDAVTDPIQERGTLEVLSRTLNRIDSIFRYAIFNKWCEHNPASGRGEYLAKGKVKHMNFLEEKDLPKFLHDLDAYQGNIICKSAVELVLLTHVRTKELRFAEWAEIDFDNKLWHIPAHRMKMDVSQTIPLPSQAIELLEKLKPITGESKYIFASLQAMSKPISENGMLSVIYNMGWKGKTTIHGLARSTFSTIANEKLKFRPDVIEATLAHKVKDPVRGAYNHATYLDERIDDAQTWADYLDRIKKGAEVIPIRKVQF